MPNQPPPRKLLQNVTTGRKTPGLPKPNANGRDKDRPLDPRIANMAEFLDRCIRTRNETVGVVVAAVGILLGRKGMDSENLERLIYDVTMAIRVGFYLHQGKGK